MLRVVGFGLFYINTRCQLESSGTLLLKLTKSNCRLNHLEKWLNVFRDRVLEGTYSSFLVDRIGVIVESKIFSA